MKTASILAKRTARRERGRERVREREGEREVLSPSPSPSSSAQIILYVRLTLGWDVGVGASKEISWKGDAI